MTWGYLEPLPPGDKGSSLRVEQVWHLPEVRGCGRRENTSEQGVLPVPLSKGLPRSRCPGIRHPSKDTGGRG